MALRDSRWWDREFEQELPDSRLSGMARERKRIFYRGQWWERCYCADCGADAGLLTADWSPHFFFVCDSCVAKKGDPPGAVKVA